MTKRTVLSARALSCLQHAKDLIDKAESRGGYTFLFQTDSKRIYRALEEAKKDNNFIYHAKVPDRANMATLGKHDLAMACSRC